MQLERISTSVVKKNISTEGISAEITAADEVLCYSEIYQGEMCKSWSPGRLNIFACLVWNLLHFILLAPNI